MYPIILNEQQINEVAKVCHEANKAWCESGGDQSQQHWEEAEEWQRASAIEGVKWRLDNRNAPNSAQHDAWCADKAADGWTYGATKDPQAKTHPCLVPYGSLPPFQQAKDALFTAIVLALGSREGDRFGIGAEKLVLALEPQNLDYSPSFHCRE